MGMFRPRLPEPVSNAGRKESQQAERSQVKNQKQAARSAGRGSRSIGGQGSSRSKPSRTF